MLIYYTAQEQIPWRTCHPYAEKHTNIVRHFGNYDQTVAHISTHARAYN